MQLTEQYRQVTLDGIHGLWLRLFSGEAGVREKINVRAKLTHKEAKVLWARLPAEQGGQGKTLDEVADVIGISKTTKNRRERPRQLEAKARTKASFDVSVAQFKNLAAGLSREDASVTTAREAGLRTTVNEGFQARETPERPEDMVSDRMLAILEEADRTGRHLTESQRQAVQEVYISLMTRIENEAGRSKSKGFTTARIEKAFRAGLEAAQNGTAHGQAGNRHTAEIEAVMS